MENTKIRLARYKGEYSTQPWYNEDIYIYIKLYPDRYIPYLGYDCVWENLKTGVRHHNWDKTMEEISEYESTEILREYNIDKLLG